VDRDTGTERSETMEGKMKEVVLLVAEKRVCTRFETAPNSKARAVLRAGLMYALGFGRAVSAVARWSTPERGL
jgi:hypothetical protein